jgi:hypothetical protein
VVEHLPSKCEALSSNSSTGKRKEKKERERKRERKKKIFSDPKSPLALCPKRKAPPAWRTSKTLSQAHTPPGDTTPS